MRLAMVCVLAVVPAIAAADPITFSVAGKGSRLELTFKNTSAKPVTMPTHVRAGLDHYDWLRVTLRSKTTTRKLQFFDVRTKAIPIEETIAPGKSLSRSVDLAMWAFIAGNGEPLAPDSYDVDATWDSTGNASGPKVKLTASTKLIVPKPIENGCKESGKPKAGIELFARQVGNTATLEVGLHNTSATSRCVYGIIQTHEIQNDWLHVSFTVPGEKAPRVIGFSGDRDKSYPKQYELPPGATLWTKWDLADWNKRMRGSKPLPKTGLVMTVVWDATRENEVWNGKLQLDVGVNL